MFAKIVGTGRYLPSNIVTNYDLEKRLDTSHEWIIERTGIEQRHIATEDETTSSMGANAAKEALKDAGIDPLDIGLIIVATSTPDKTFPSVGATIQAEIGALNAAAFDISAACSGFVYALSIADQFIKTGQQKHIIVIGAELYSRALDWTDRSTCVLFGDGAAAAVLSSDEHSGIISTHLYTDGRHGELLQLGKSSISSDESYPYLQMKGNEVFKYAVTKLYESVKEALEENNIDAEDVNWLIPHQANLRIINATAKKMGLPSEKVIVTVNQHANTSAASIPLALDVARKDGRIKAGDLVLMEAFGGGFTWGSALVRM